VIASEVDKPVSQMQDPGPNDFVGDDSHVYFGIDVADVDCHVHQRCTAPVQQEPRLHEPAVVRRGLEHRPSAGRYHTEPLNRTPTIQPKRYFSADLHQEYDVALRRPRTSA
jgi:hypothetical protein